MRAILGGFCGGERRKFWGFGDALGGAMKVVLAAKTI